jgi:pilus assembly protein Flp/PilA
MLVYNREKGQGLVEYALIMIMVAMVVIVVLALLGPAIANAYQNVIEQLPG